MQKTILIKQQDYQSVVQLTIPQQKNERNCWNCELDKPNFLITHKQDETYEKKYCWSCTLSSFYELEKSDYQVENKKEIIKELRAAIYQYERQQQP